MRASVGIAVLIAAAIDAFVGRDLSWATAARPQGYERLIHLFVYNYGRVWPEQFDYRPILTGFSVICVGLIGISAFRGVRPVASRALLGAALMFTSVNFLDGGSVVLDAMVITKSRSFREGGRGALAEETIKGIGRFLVTAKTGDEELDDILP